MLKPFLAHRPYKNWQWVGFGWWAVICWHLLWRNDRMYFNNLSEEWKGCFRKSAQKSQGEAIWWTGGPVGFVLKLRAWSVFSQISFILTCFPCISGNSGGGGGGIHIVPWRHWQYSCFYVFPHSAHLYWNTYHDIYTLDDRQSLSTSSHDFQNLLSIAGRQTVYIRNSVDNIQYDQKTLLFSLILLN